MLKQRPYLDSDNNRPRFPAKPRIGLRVSRESKRKVAWAAKLLGQPVNALIVKAMDLVSSVVIKTHQPMELEPEEYKTFLRVLDENRLPSPEAIKQARETLRMVGEWED